MPYIADTFHQSIPKHKMNLYSCGMKIIHTNNGSNVISTDYVIGTMMAKDDIEAKSAFKIAMDKHLITIGLSAKGWETTNIIAAVKIPLKTIETVYLSHQ